ncbi:PREDICTED: cation-dependent mannose-6-phosphate receptor-like [Atta cephalotes]|uniref:Cation-dependent mannose-6-phosphate receptor n=1 Tax=Atta cephalotes TaxID=12957 RepID=A0A158NKQ7_ATTCE|nr:PREDICTED: cation-dependent mannose-6-phosphate receptor-like [Atta cephalotes]
MSTKTKLGKMCRSNATFIVFSLFLIFFCDTTSSECVQEAPCICSLPDGYYYNLTALADAKSFSAKNNDNYTVYFHPCTNVNMTIENKANCSTENVSLCIHNNVNKTVLTTGTVKETRMKLSDNDKFPIFEIHHNDTKIVINIVCYMGDKETNFILDSISAKIYYFKLVSSYGCKLQREMGLSMGSLLVILFFVSVGVYFIGGIIVLKALRGATGWEMVPNHEFWCKLPSLVRDGVVFAFNCCRADSYERI